MGNGVCTRGCMRVHEHVCATTLCQLVETGPWLTVAFSCERQPRLAQTPLRQGSRASSGLGGHDPKALPERRRRLTFPGSDLGLCSAAMTGRGSRFLQSCTRRERSWFHKSLLHTHTHTHTTVMVKKKPTLFIKCTRVGSSTHLHVTHNKNIFPTERFV